MNDQELLALISLLDDSDSEIYRHVSDKLLSLGPAVIEKLEDAYTTVPDPLVQQRIENIIHQIQFESIEKDLVHWVEHDSDNLLAGILIVTRHQYPELDEEKIIKYLSRVKKDIWISLNNYLSPLEQMNVINQTLFGHYNLLGNSNAEQEQRLSYLHHVIESSKGNHFSLGLLYLLLCQQLEMPVYGVRLSNHFILARTKDFISDFNKKDLLLDILFYVNPFNKGLAFSEREIHIYLKKIDIEPAEKYFSPASNILVIKEYLSFLAKQYTKPQKQDKADDLNRLNDLIAE